MTYLVCMYDIFFFFSVVLKSLLLHTTPVRMYYPPVHWYIIRAGSSYTTENYSPAKVHAVVLSQDREIMHTFSISPYEDLTLWGGEVA